VLNKTNILDTFSAFIKENNINFITATQLQKQNSYIPYRNKTSRFDLVIIDYINKIK
jgi:hypothetical protein